MKHCGHAHHFIAADSCRFHLATFVADGHVLVSTVGDYWYGDKRRTLSWAADSFFETMVFYTNPNDTDDGCPRVIRFSELDCRRYADAGRANDRHERLCHEYNTAEFAAASVAALADHAAEATVLP